MEGAEKGDETVQIRFVPIGFCHARVKFRSIAESRHCLVASFSLASRPASESTKGGNVILGNFVPEGRRQCESGRIKRRRDPALAVQPESVVGNSSAIAFSAFFFFFFLFSFLFFLFFFPFSFLFANTIFLSLFIVDDNTNAPPSTSESPNTEVGNL